MHLHAALLGLLLAVAAVPSGAVLARKPGAPSRNSGYATGWCGRVWLPISRPSLRLPLQHPRNGSAYGRHNDYTRPGGAAPLCYPTDITGGHVAGLAGTEQLKGAIVSSNGGEELLGGRDRIATRRLPGESAQRPGCRLYPADTGGPPTRANRNRAAATRPAVPVLPPEPLFPRTS